MDQCVFCAQTFSESGNDARPLRDGRCCDACNQQKVIPARYEDLFGPKEPGTPKSIEERLEEVESRLNKDGIGTIIDDGTTALQQLSDFTIETALRVDKIARKTDDLGHNLECTESGLLDFINEVVDRALNHPEAPHQEQIKKLEDQVAKLTKELEESKKK